MAHETVCLKKSIHKLNDYCQWHLTFTLPKYLLFLYLKPLTSIIASNINDIIIALTSTFIDYIQLTPLDDTCFLIHLAIPHQLILLIFPPSLIWPTSWANMSSFINQHQFLLPLPSVNQHYQLILPLSSTQKTSINPQITS